MDKYQGEENEIILLSLVRSNDEGKIGFLSIENRVCVALSRAKRGLFIIGNMDMLSQKSELWNEIKETLERQYSIGEIVNYDNIEWCFIYLFRKISLIPK